MIVAAVLAASLTWAAQDAAYKDALDLLYDGQPHRAEARAAAVADAFPQDPLGPYPLALVLCWKAEAQTEGSAAETAFFAQVERLLRHVEGHLKKDPKDPRAILARGAAYAVRTRYHMMRHHKRESARDAVKMREDFMTVRRLGHDSEEVALGLGLYDYFADILPRYMKLLRVFAGIPGGNRERGLAAIQEAADSEGLHATEARIQLFEIHTYWEPHADRAADDIRRLRKQYPGWPLWGLKLAEHLRDRMGLYREAAHAAREVLQAGARGHPNYAGTSLAMARLSLGESLLLDLRLAEAQRELLRVPEVAEAPRVTARARYLAGRSLELAGDRPAALRLYQQAVQGGDKETKRRAEAGLRRAIPIAEIQGTQMLARARRLEEAGRHREALEQWHRAHAAFPESREAALRVAENELSTGDPETARAMLAAFARDDDENLEPLLRPLGILLVGQLADLDGERESAVRLYKKVLHQPYGRSEIAARADDGLKQPFTRRDLRSEP